MSYAIVIPAVDNNELSAGLLRNLLSSIVIGEYTCPVVICWDNVPQDVIGLFEAEFPFITSLPFLGESCLNFAANSNRGLRYIHKELGLGTFLVNMDVCLPHRRYLEQVITDGVSSPTCRHIDGTAEEKLAILDDIANRGCPQEHAPVVDRHRLLGFCLWISNSTMSKIGYLDELTFKASFEDDDYCVRAWLAGIRCTEHWLPVHHELKGRGENLSTTNAYDTEQLVDHFHRFRKKWNIPFDIPREEFPQYILSHHEWCDDWKCS
jgi:Predicted glycosyltransferases